MLQRQPQRPRPRPREITIPEEATRHPQQIQPQARPQQCLQLRVHLQHLLHHHQLLRQLQVIIQFWRENSNYNIFGAKIQIFYLFFRRLIIVIYVFFIREKCDQFGQFAAFGAAKGQAQPKDCQQPAEQQCWRKLQQCGHRQEQEVPIAGCATTAQPAVSPVATG